MMSDFNLLANILSNWPDCDLHDKILSDAVCNRLHSALIDLKIRPNRVGTGDIAGLVRHVLRRETVRQQSVLPPKLRVPIKDGWPDKKTWELFGINAVPISGFFKITADKFWTPDWLDKSDDYPPFHDALLEINRRKPVTRIIDPCILDKTDFKYYTCPGQQTFIRSIFNSGPDATLIINSPTGSGKSLAAWLPTLLSPLQANLTLVVVPTVSLAMDQERQMQKLLNNYRQPLAWYGDLNETDKILLKQSITNGTQRIIFTSPESLVGALSNSLYEATKKGFLKYFIIDEAHLVSQWGNEFRPHFQAIAGIRRDLQRVSSNSHEFRTLLMTATLTEDTFTTICTLFGPSDKIEILSSLHLRPEPSYWISYEKNENLKNHRILEIIRHTPRPFLLYVTKREDAANWKRRLADELDIKRVESFHGNTASPDRKKIIGKWLNNEIDVVVATSAFGVGMDKEDVRTVIHACVPETVDRYYQEVGRGGRDGNASVSFLIYTDEDKKVAKGLSQDTIIGTDKGLLRWRTMFFNKRDFTHIEDTVCVDLKIAPKNILQHSDTNTSWNMRTLLLMARTGLIEIESETPPQIEKNNDETKEEFELRKNEILNDYFTQCIVKISENGHLDPEVWRNRVEDERQRIIAGNNNNYKLMEELLSGTREISEIMCEVYSLPNIVPPMGACGGCPQCRATGINLLDYSTPNSQPIKEIYLDPNYKNGINEFGSNTTLIVYEPPENDERALKRWRKDIIKFLKIIIPRYGIGEIAVNSNWLELKGYCKLYQETHNHFLVHCDINEEENYFTTLQLPRITIIEPQYPAQTISQDFITLIRPFHILIVQSNTLDENPSRTYLTESFQNHKKLKNILRSIS